MSAEPPQVAVVIPSWNSVGLLPGCLDSLTAESAVVELFVVENGSSDGTLELLRERGVEQLALDRNEGFAKAANLGAARTAAPAVLALNADTVLEPGAAVTLTSDRWAASSRASSRSRAEYRRPRGRPAPQRWPEAKVSP